MEIIEKFEIFYDSSASSRNKYVDQYITLKSAKTNGKVIREMTSIRFDLVGNFDNHDRQQFGRTGCMWTSHCRTFSKLIGSPG